MHSKEKGVTAEVFFRLTRKQYMKQNKRENEVLQGGDWPWV